MMGAMLAAFLLIATQGVSAADKKAETLTCVGLYSETSDGSISYQVAKKDWVVIKVGDVIPVAATIRINVDRDWIELTPTGNPNVVYDLEGSDKGDVIKTVPEILKGKSRTVSFPKKSNATDPRFKNKLVVAQLVGRQIYTASPDSDDKDMQYGDVLDIKGKVNIIGINNTLVLMFPNGAVTTVVGPLNFPVEKVFTGQNLYKYLNVAK
jgi:hypothetical protein